MSTAAAKSHKIKGIPFELVGKETGGMRRIPDDKFVKKMLGNIKVISLSNDTTDALGLSVVAQAEGNMPLNDLLAGSLAAEELVYGGRGGRTQEQGFKPSRKSMRTSTNQKTYVPS